MKNDLSHLNANELKILKDEYYGKGTVKNLIELYGLNIRPNNLYKFFPDEETDLLCPYCQIKMYKPSVSKSELNYRYRTIKVFCKNCNHENHNKCNCDGCLAIRLEQIQKEKKFKFDLLNKMFKVDTTESVFIENATVRERIYLGALLISRLDDDLNTIQPLNEFYTSIAPYYNFEYEIIFSLVSNGFIKIDLENSIDEFSIYHINEERSEVTYDFRKLYFKVNFQSLKMSQIEIIDSLINPVIDISSDDLLSIWKMIALNEVFEYMQFTVEMLFRIDFLCGTKSKLVLEKLLDRYSVGQIYNLIYSRSNYALRFKTERNINSRHAVNSIITMISNYSEKVDIEKWELKNYTRPYECQESVLSKFFFGKILKIGEKGFSVPPNKDVFNEN